MKIVMYGTEACPDCASALAKLASLPDIDLDYRDILKSLKTLKEFLSYRDHDEGFAPIVQAGGIGIPFYILDDQTRTFNTEDILNIYKNY